MFHADEGYLLQQRLSIAVRDYLQVDMQEGTTEMLTTILAVSYIFQKIRHNSTRQKSPYQQILSERIVFVD